MRPDAELLDLLYSAAMGERPWEDFVCALDEGVPEGTSILFYLDANRTSGALSVSGNIDRGWVDAFDSHYGRLNPFTPAAAVRPIGRGVVAEEMLPRAELETTEFYNDFLRPFGKHSAVGITILREAGTSLLLSTMTASRDEEEKRPFADRLTRLSPHVRRAFELYRDRTTGALASQLSGALDASDVGILMISAAGAVVHQTEAAGRILDHTRIAYTTPLGRFRFRDEKAEHALAGLQSGAPGDIASIKLENASLVMRRSVFDPVLDRVFGAVVTIILHQTITDIDHLSIEGVASRYHLTQAEQRILRSVIKGATLNQIALQTGRSRETVKSHLSSIYAKTGVSRRDALVPLLLRSGA